MRALRCVSCWLRGRAQVKAGMCAAHLGDAAAAAEQLRPLLAESAGEYADLYLEVGDLLASHALHEEVRPRLAGPPCQNSM